MKEATKIYHYSPQTGKFEGKVSDAKINKKTREIVVPDHATVLAPPKHPDAVFLRHVGWRLKVYHYDPVSFDYHCTSFEPFDPIDGKPLIPAHATLQEPLCGYGGDGKAAVFNPATQDWSLVPDCRGVWYNPDGSEQTINSPGIEPREGSTRTPPPPTPEQLIAGIRKEAARRIKASGHDWKVTKAISQGKKPPKEIVAYAEAVRASSNALENALPIDYTADHYWPEVITE